MRPAAPALARAAATVHVGQTMTANSTPAATADVAVRDMAAHRAAAAGTTVVVIQAPGATLARRVVTVAVAGTTAAVRAVAQVLTGGPGESGPEAGDSRAVVRRTAHVAPMRAVDPAQAGARTSLAGSARPGVRTSGAEFRSVATAIGLVGRVRRATAAGRAATVPRGAAGQVLTGRSAAVGRAATAPSAPATGISAAGTGRSVVAGRTGRSERAIGTSAAGRAAIGTSAAGTGRSVVAGRTGRSERAIGTSAAGRAAIGTSEAATGRSVVAGRTRSGRSGPQVGTSVVAGRTATGPSAASTGTSVADGPAATSRRAVVGKARTGSAAAIGRGLPARAMTGRDGLTAVGGLTTVVGQAAPGDPRRLTAIAARRGPTRVGLTRVDPVTSTSAWTCPTPSRRISLIPRRWQSCGRCRVISPA